MSERTSEGAGTLDRRGQYTSVAGLFVQVLLGGSLLAVGVWGEHGSDAMVSAALHVLGGVPIWLILLIVFALRQRSRLEDLETEQLRRMQDSGLATNIFDVGDESMLLHRRRLSWTYRFLLPAFTVLIALYHLYVGGAFLLTSWRAGLSPLTPTYWSRSSSAFPLMLFMAGVAVFSFAYARYVIGMSRDVNWRLLRAGGSYLLGNALTAVVVLAAMALAQIQTTEMWAEPVAAYVIRVGVLLLGLEISANFILDFYRPHRLGEEIRPAFESRLLALFSEPGGVMRSIAHTMNYQFGFEVSGTWFYQLVQRSVFPLAVLTVIVLIALSAVVIVDVDEEAYVERFGALVQAEGETLGSGLHLKWPWPIDRVVRQRVEMVRTLVVGSEHGEGGPDDHGHHDHTKAILWGEKHDFNPEMLMIVAHPRGAESEDFGASSTRTGEYRRARSVAVSLLMISLEIQYRIKNLRDYQYRYHEPERALESIAYQDLSNLAASVSSMELMGCGREDFGRRMQERLQRRCDELGLGIQLRYVALQEAHPPADSQVAETFQNVVAAEIRKKAAISSANGQSDRILTLTAGSVGRARELDDAIRRLDAVSVEIGDADDPAVAAARARVDDLIFGNEAAEIQPASGAVAGQIARAKAEREVAISAAESKVRSFRNDLVAYQTAADLYKTRRYLQLLRERLGPLRKFVFTSPVDSRDVVVEYETKERPTLDLGSSAME